MSVASLSMQRIVRSVGDMFKQSLVLTDETDQWFKETHDHLTEVEQSLDELYGEFRFLSGDHKDLSKAMFLLNRSLSALSLCEENTVLSFTLDKLADLHAGTGTIENYNADMTIALGQVFSDQIQSIKNFKDRIIARSHEWRTLANNEQLLKTKREAKVQSYLFGKINRAEQSKKEINEIEKHISTLKEKLAVTDAMIRADYEVFTNKRLQDLKAGMLNWLKMMAECEQKILDNWEGLSKEINNANK